MTYILPLTIRADFHVGWYNPPGTLLDESSITTDSELPHVWDQLVEDGSTELVSDVTDDLSDFADTTDNIYAEIDGPIKTVHSSDSRLWRFESA